MNPKRTLEELNDSLKMNFFDEAWEESIAHALKLSEKFILKNPHLSSYKDIYAKMIFLSSNTQFLKDKYSQINCLSSKKNHRGFSDIKNFIWLNGKTLFLLLLSTLSFIKTRFFRKFPPVSGPKIGVELSEGFRTHEFRSDLNFDLSSLGYENIVFIDFQNVVGRYTEPELKILKTCLDKGTILITNYKVPFKKNVYQIPRPVIRKFQFGLEKKAYPSFIFWEYYPFIILSEFFWTYLFKKLAIKGWFPTVEDHLDNLVQVKIMKGLNAVTFNRQRSDHSTAKGLFYYPADIFFNWSEASSSHFKQHNFNKVIKPIGHNYLNSERWNSYEEYGTNVRELFPKNAFIITVFDNLAGDLCEFSTENFHLLITYLLELINKNSNVRVIFKLKKKHFINYYPHREAIQELIDEKKIVLFDGYLLATTLGLASDLSIGTVCSSALCEINIAAKRGIYFWPGPKMSHPLASAELRHLLFKTMDELKLGVEEVLSNSSSGIGLLTKEQGRLFDQYRDFLGPARILFCLKKLLEKDITREGYIEWISAVDLKKLD